MKSLTGGLGLGLEEDESDEGTVVVRTDLCMDEMSHRRKRDASARKQLLHQWVAVHLIPEVLRSWMNTEQTYFPFYRRAELGTHARGV